MRDRVRIRDMFGVRNRVRFRLDDRVRVVRDMVSG